MITTRRADTDGDVKLRAVKYLKGTFIGMVILGLIFMNVATIVNDQIHSMGYQALKGLAAYALGEAAQGRLFSSSPTAKRSLEVAKATQALQAERNTLKNENQRLSKSNQDLNSRILKRNQVASKVLPSMRARASRVAIRNATSVVGEAIPYIGIAVTLGVTAADLHDMCEQDKEISALLTSNELVMSEQYQVCGMKLPTKQQVVDQLTSGWQAAYLTAVGSVNQSGKYIDSLNPPRVVWADVKSTVCPVLSYKLAVCD